MVHCSSFPKSCFVKTTPPSIRNIKDLKVNLQPFPIIYKTAHSKSLNCNWQYVWIKMSDGNNPHHSCNSSLPAYLQPHQSKPTNSPRHWTPSKLHLHPPGIRTSKSGGRGQDYKVGNGKWRQKGEAGDQEQSFSAEVSSDSKRFRQPQPQL